MGRPNGSKTGTNEQALRALHEAAIEAGYGGKLITVKEWERLIIDLLGMRTRQDVADKTWAMDRAGLIEHEKRRGVRFIPLQQPGQEPAKD